MCLCSGQTQLKTIFGLKLTNPYRQRPVQHSGHCIYSSVVLSNSSRVVATTPTIIFLALHVNCFTSPERAWEELQQGGNTVSLPLISRLEKHW